MSWQEELRRLDEELAAGRLSADEYRVRRDQVMSSAVSPSSQAQPPQTNAAEATTTFSPVAQPGAETHDPNADKTQIVSGQGGGFPERTQVVGSGNSAPERTEVVQGWQAARPSSDAERTQVVPGVPPQAVSYGQAPRSAPGQQGFAPHQSDWNNQQEDLSPPWAGAEFPPLAPATGGWVQQGPEVFETSGKSNAGKVWLTVGLVVLLLGIGAGAYFYFRPDSTPTAGGNGGQTTTQPAPTTTTKVRMPGAPVAELPGQVSNTSKIKTFADVEAIKYLTAKEIEAYKAGGAGESKIGIAKKGDVQIIILVVQLQDDATAVTARDALAALQQEYKMTPLETKPGVVAASSDTATNGPIRRAHYASGKQLVRIQVQGKDAVAVDTLLTDMIAAQLEELPANV